VDDSVPVPGLEAEDFHDVLDGRRAYFHPPWPRESVLLDELANRLSAFARPAGSGEAFRGVRFALPLPFDVRRRAGVAFVPAGRWPRHRPIPDGDSWPVLPDLCAEVVGPNDRAGRVRGLVADYLCAGVRLVWVLYPELGLADVYEAADRVRVLGRADALDGGPVLPGFRLPLADLFPPPEATPAGGQS
jgi:Uma2 family endonuclease